MTLKAGSHWLRTVVRIGVFTLVGNSCERLRIVVRRGVFTKERSQHRVLTCCELSQCIAEVVNSGEQS